MISPVQTPVKPRSDHQNRRTNHFSGSLSRPLFKTMEILTGLFKSHSLKGSKEVEYILAKKLPAQEQKPTPWQLL